jgi:hypothetical protein
LNLCEYTGASTFTLPANIVTFMNSATNTCPTGFSAFVPAQGRFLVFVSASADLSTARVSPASVNTSSLADIGAHTHSIPSYSFTTNNICMTSGVCGPGSKSLRGSQTLSWSQSVGTGSSRVSIPYVQLVACEVTDTTTNSVLPSSDAIFYYDGNSCPPNYRDATSRSDTYDYSQLIGRLPYIKYSTNDVSATYWGGTQFSYATSVTAPPVSDPGHAVHSHSISISGFQFSPNYASGTFHQLRLTATLHSEERLRMLHCPSRIED